MTSNIEIIDTTNDSVHRVIFGNSDKATQNLCRTFWHNSQQLPPTYESTLVTNGIKQQLKKAPNPGDMSAFSRKEFLISNIDITIKYLQKVYLREEKDEAEMYETLARRREKIKADFKKQQKLGVVSSKSTTIPRSGIKCYGDEEGHIELWEDEKLAGDC